MAGDAARPPLDSAADEQAWQKFLKAAVARYGPGGVYWGTRYHEQYGAGATPQPIVDKLNQAITKILARPDIKEAWEKTGATPIVMTQPEFKAFMDAQVAKWANVIKANNIPPIN